VSEKKALMMLNQAPFDCDLRQQMLLLQTAKEGGALLMGDAVFFAATGKGEELQTRGVKVYALEDSVDARGLGGRMLPGVELVDYHRAIDLIMDEYDIVV
jgi:sulfur relay protein TusB/DsrH